MNTLDSFAPRFQRSFSSLRALLTGCALLCAPLVASAQVVYLVNDTFSDTDRIGGTDGSTSSSSSPTVNTATSTNTQWVVNGAKQMVASASGMVWNMDKTTNRMALGYFPTVDVSSGPVTISLGFTTGSLGGTADTFRFALLNGSAAGYRTTDGFGSTDASYVGDVGYAIWSATSNVGGNSTTDLVLRTHERVTTSSNDLLGTSNDWGTNLGASSGATGKFQADTSYLLSVTFNLVSGTLNIMTSLTGGDFEGMSYLVSDADAPTLSFDMLALRLGKGSNQFSNITFDSLVVTTVSAVPEPSSYALLAGLAMVGVVAGRRRRSPAVAAA